MEASRSGWESARRGVRRCLPRRKACHAGRPATPEGLPRRKEYAPGGLRLLGLVSVHDL